MSERRTDPSDGQAYTFGEIQQFYKGKYSRREIDQYWQGLRSAGPAQGPQAGGQQQSSARGAAQAGGVGGAAAADALAPADTLPIDGSFGEGGGQVLRNTFAYAAVLGKPIRVSKIRAGRPKPGLAAQHLTGITAVAELARGQLIGAEARSVEVLFLPSVPGSGESAGDGLKPLVADCGTAGAITLVIQSVLPVLALGAAGQPAPPVGRRAAITCIGGSDVPFSPPVDYLQDVALPCLRRFGVDASLDIEARGLMPAGGGIVHVACAPVEQLTAAQLLDCGQLASLRVRVLYCGEELEPVAQKAVATAVQKLKAAYPEGVIVEQLVGPVEPLKARGSSFVSVSATARTTTDCVLNGNAMDTSRKPNADRLANEACDYVLASIRRGACLDEHCADQVIIFMALASGESAYRTGPLTEHTQTAIHFAQLCTGAEFKVEEVPGSAGELFEVRCTGIGWQGTHPES